MASKVLFVNHLQDRCGVYQYGKRLFDCLLEDTRYEHKYVAVNDEASYIESVQSFQPDLIIINWHEATMTWFNRRLNYLVKAKQFIVFHEGALPADLAFDGIFSVAGAHSPGDNVHAVQRPLIDFAKKERKKNDPIKIGSFGFGFNNKGFDRICQLVQEQFDAATLHLHITTAYFGQINEYVARNIIEQCKSMVTKPGIELVITTDFVNDDELLSFLHNNDINIFLYDDEPHRKAVSSIIDYVVSAEACFAVNSSSMFKHLGECWDGVNVDKTSLSDIIDNGNATALKLKSEWSGDNIRDAFYNVIKEI